MPFSQETRTNYIELINEKLDNILVEKIEDFDPIVEALYNVMVFKNSASVLEAISDIKETIDNPDLYVQEADYAEFNTLFFAGIQRKIKEFENMSDIEKANYIANQKAIKSENARSSELTARLEAARGPQPLEHTTQPDNQTLVVNQALQIQQVILFTSMNSRGNVHRNQNILNNRLYNALRLSTEINVSHRQISLMTDEVFNELTDAADAVITLVRAHHISVEEIIRLNPAQRQILFSNILSDESTNIIVGIQQAQQQRRRSRSCAIL